MCECAGGPLPKEFRMKRSIACMSIVMMAAIVFSGAGQNAAADMPSPVIKPIPAISVPAGGPVIIPVSATNPNGKMLMYSVMNAPQGATMTKEGVLYWKPGMAGTYEFSVKVSDGVAPRVSAPVTVEVSYEAVQVAPTIEPLAGGLVT